MAGQQLCNDRIGGTVCVARFILGLLAGQIVEKEHGVGRADLGPGPPNADFFDFVDARALLTGMVENRAGRKSSDRMRERVVSMDGWVSCKV